MQVPEREPRTIFYGKTYRLQQKCGINVPKGPKAVFTESILKKRKKRNVILYVCKVQYG